MKQSRKYSRSTRQAGHELSALCMGLLTGTSLHVLCAVLSPFRVLARPDPLLNHKTTFQAERSLKMRTIDPSRECRYALTCLESFLVILLAASRFKFHGSAWFQTRSPSSNVIPSDLLSDSSRGLPVGISTARISPAQAAS